LSLSDYLQTGQRSGRLDEVSWKPARHLGFHPSTRKELRLGNAGEHSMLSPLHELPQDGTRLVATGTTLGA
jgi:hypothetical protein